VQLSWGPAALTFGRAKNVKIRRDFGQLKTLIANISRRDTYIENGKIRSSTTTSPTFDEKIRCELWSANKKGLNAPKIKFSEDYI